MRSRCSRSSRRSSSAIRGTCRGRPSSPPRTSCSGRSRSPPRSACTPTRTSPFWSSNGRADTHTRRRAATPGAGARGGTAPLAGRAAAQEDRGGAGPLYRGTGGGKEGGRHRGPQPLAARPGAILLPPGPPSPLPPLASRPGEGSREVGESRPLFVVSSKGDVTSKPPEADTEAQERRRRSREKLRQQLKEGKLEERDVEV